MFGDDFWLYNIDPMLVVIAYLYHCNELGHTSFVITLSQDSSLKMGGHTDFVYVHQVFRKFAVTWQARQGTR